MDDGEFDAERAGVNFLEQQKQRSPPQAGAISRS